MPIQPWFKFLRLSALPSAWADVCGGTALALAVLPAWAIGALWPRTAFLLLATTGIYLGGMALNDVLHIDKDRELAKPRPLATGLIAPRPALTVTGALYAIGLAAALLAGCFWPALALALLTAAYNDLASAARPSMARAAAGVGVLAACRALHVTLPLWAYASVTPVRSVDGPTLVALFAGSVFVYIALVTLVSLFEDRGGGKTVLWVVHFALIPAVLGLPLWLADRNRLGQHAMVGAVLALTVAVVLIGAMHRKLGEARRNPSARSLGQVVGQGIRGQCLLMCAFAFGLAPVRPEWGIAALACYAAGWWLSGRISPT